MNENELETKIIKIMLMITIYFSLAVISSLELQHPKEKVSISFLQKVDPLSLDRFLMGNWAINTN